MYLFDFADGAFKVEKILEFSEYNKFPLVVKLTEINNIKVYASSINLQVGDTSSLLCLSS